jgi:hypothetical protein
MAYNNFILRKLTLDREKEMNEWRISRLKDSIIPHIEHELKTVKELGLEYVSVANRLDKVKREYRELSGLDYNSSC